MRRDKLGLLALALLSLSIAGIAGTLVGDERQDLLEEFRKADVPRRLELLPRLTKVYGEKELPAEARYLQALQLLRPHLSWSAPNLVSPRDVVKIEQMRDVKRADGDHWRWSEALGAEPWMFADVPTDVREKARKSLAEWRHERKEGPPKLPEPRDYSWRLKDPGHADVVRAVHLLARVKEGELACQAQRWLEEIERNNTVLTLDVTGSFGVGKAAPVVLDARNAPRVKCKLHRVRRPDDLLWVANRIGKDFVYRDHGLQQEQERIGEQALLAREGVGKSRSGGNRAEKPVPVPDALRQNPLWEQDLAVTDLKVARADLRERWSRYEEESAYRAGDGDYFEDSCERYRDRLDRNYQRRVGEWTSWQCNRIVEVPGKVLAEPGAYVLAVEAAGQTVYAPLLVDPLSLTLRRCRDGVLVAVADSAGQKPVAEATIHGRDMLGQAVTDAEGLGFAKVYAGGDRAIVVHQEGRFAVGGFGRVFEGIYVSPLEREERLHRFGDMKETARKALEAQAQVYADRHVVAAYTDRPTYRPDQDVHFKIIVRRLAADSAETREGPPVFRAEDFELKSRLELPANGLEVPFALVDPKGRAVAHGQVTLNEFGTAAGKVRLSAEAAVGTYALRVRLAGVERLVPEVCAVEYYRLPAFKLEVEGVPEKVRQPGDLRIELAGAYYFGKPLADGQVEVRLTRADGMRTLCQGEAVLDEAGKAGVTLKPGKDLVPGRYVVRCELSDESGRRVQRVLPYTIEQPERPRTGLGALPRFVPLEQPLEFPTKAAVVVAEQVRRNKDDRQVHRFVPRDGRATLRFPAPGWYTLSADREQVDLFVHGGTDHPGETRGKRQDQILRKLEMEPEDESDDSRLIQTHGWIDLTDDAEERNPGWRQARGSRLLALFDRQSADVGDVLRVLVHVRAKKARLLFTMEGYTVVDYYTTTVDGARGHYHVVEIPIKRRHLPHFYLRGWVLEGGNPDWHDWADEARAQRMEKVREEEGRDLPWCRIDVRDPKALPGGETLRVETRTARLEYRPGESVDVRVQVRDRTGKPVAAEVSLAAIDASVYSFGEDRLSGLAALFDDPHPAQRFYAKAWRSSTGNRWELLTEQAQNQAKAIQMLEKLSLRGEAKEGKGGEERPGLAALPLEPLPVLDGERPVASLPLGRLRSDFRETAAWLPQLRTDASGELRTTFKLPDTLTRYRLSTVALTQSTEIGTGRAEVRVSLPLAVQVLLPRFAVEGDRLPAIGIIHNNGSSDRVCDIAWRVDGAVPDGQVEPATLGEWKQDAGTAAGKVTVPAGKSVRVGLWLKFSSMGPVKVELRCAGGADADGEMRALSVQPLGRERGVSFDGAFTDSTRVQLPAGFVARDVHVVLSRSNVARALDGIAGLVEYPYGCVEQTMSRFLPAVLVREAGQRGPFTLPLDVQAKLPLVLEQGLTRLYKFQHADGGWGWWEHDKTDPRMTVYVVYGLARCAGAGVRVDQDVLVRGTGWLKAHLADGSLQGFAAVEAWLALAHAGQANGMELRTFAEKLLKSESPAGWCCLAAQACRSAGLADVAERLWKPARAWQPEEAEDIARLLKAQVLFGEPLPVCLRSAGRLMKLRSGLGFGSTQATAAALDALSMLIPALAAEPPLKSVRVTAGGKVMLNLSRPEELKEQLFRVRLIGDRLPIQEALEITVAAEGGASVFYTIEASGTQRQDRVEPIGGAIKVSRTFETLTGQPLTRKVTVGQTLAVRLRVTLERPCNYVLIEDRRPAGCEFADAHLHGKDAAGLANVEFRDDRVCAFAASLPAGLHEFVYYLRAETPGLSQVLPGYVYPMYQDKVRGETGAARLEIEPELRRGR